VVIVVLIAAGIYLLSLPRPQPEAVPPSAEAPEEGVPAVPEEPEAAPVAPEGEAPAVPEGEAAVPGGSPVSGEGEVITPEGAPVKPEALPGSPEAPKQSRSLKEEETPEGAVKLKVSASGYTPNEFTVKAGQVVTLCVTSEDRTHVFKFEDPALQGVAIGLAGGETRCITWKAPARTGNYPFYCDVPGHRDRGEIGVMKVK